MADISKIRISGATYTIKDEGAARSSDLSNHVNNKSNPHAVTKSQVGLGNVDNTSDNDKPVSAATKTELDKKVDKVSGKGLSTNDYTTAEKNKLAGIAAGAEVNQNAFANIIVAGTTIASCASERKCTDTNIPCLSFRS